MVLPNLQDPQKLGSSNYLLQKIPLQSLLGLQDDDFEIKQAHLRKDFYTNRGTLTNALPKEC
jgi:hypothetical protein